MYIVCFHSIELRQNLEIIIFAESSFRKFPYLLAIININFAETLQNWQYLNSNVNGNKLYN